jgi:hypothetical protein
LIPPLIFSLAVLLEESVTVIVRLNVPTVANVPESTPVVELIEIPAGFPLTVYEYGGIPPLALNGALNGTPTVADRLHGVPHPDGRTTASGGGLTVIVIVADCVLASAIGAAAQQRIAASRTATSLRIVGLSNVK